MKDTESLALFVIALTALREIYDDHKAIFKSGEQMKALQRKMDVVTILEGENL